MLNQDRTLELRSEEMQEIISAIPNWIIRWGISVIFIAISLLILGSWIIKYPEIINSRIIIITENPPAKLIARTSGKLNIFVKENEFVKTDTYLAAIENPANIKEVFELKSKLNELDTLLIEAISNIDFNKNYNLGELQTYYSNFLQSYEDYNFFIETNYHKNKIKSIETQINYYNDLNNNLMQQKEILSKELEISKKNYENDKVLFKKGLIAETKLNNSESTYLNKTYILENAEKNIIHNNIQLSEYEKTIMDLNYLFYEESKEILNSIQENYKKLKSQIAIWEQNYILKSSIDGNISLFKFWSNNQFVNIGDEVMTIVPNSQDIIGRVYLSGLGSGKVKEGQKVNIKLDSYPYKEFGVVEGRIESISLISRDNKYLINISLPNNLTSNYDKELEFRQEMLGDADIITEDLRLLERIFNQFRYLFTTAL